MMLVLCAMPFVPSTRPLTPFTPLTPFLPTPSSSSPLILLLPQPSGPTYPEMPTPIPNALSLVLAPQLQPAPVRIGRWYQRKENQAQTMPIKLPKMMSKPKWRKSGKRELEM